MKVNAIEAELLKQVRNASPEDCKAIIDALYEMPGQQSENEVDEDGEYECTPLGILCGAIVAELMGNGMFKFDYPQYIEGTEENGKEKRIE